MSKKPNIVFILIDDLGWKDLGCYGSEYYESPNIDRLKSEGMMFLDAYAACPVCSPTRASILSGKYPANVGVTDWIDFRGHLHPLRGKLIDAPYIKHLPLEEKTLASALGDGGYQTWHVGKWHLGGEEYHPEKQGFDVNIGGCHMGAPGKYGYFAPWPFPNLEHIKEGTNLTDALTDESIKLIKNRDDKPFFLNLCYYAVHTPIEAKDEHIQKFEKKAHDMGLDQIEPFELGEYYPTDNKKDKQIRRRVVQSDPVYAAMIYNLDLNIGRLFDALDSEGIQDDTIVIFTSDNGGLTTECSSPTCNAPLNEGKGWMYEGGVREPLLIKWSNVIEAGSTCDVPVTSPDFYPTLLEAAGLPLIPQQHQDGESIMPLLCGDGDMKREAIYWHYPHYGNQGGTPGSSIRMGDYKLIEFFEDNRLELYNLREDIGEENEISASHPELTKKMHHMLAAWREKVEAKIPTRVDK